MLWGMTGHFSPSQAAEQSGFSLDTLRYYARIGLLDGIERTPSGHRRFDRDDLEWLGNATMAERLGLLTEHDRQVQERIALLHAQHRHLEEKIDWYRSAMADPGGSESDCLATAGM